MNVSGGNQDDLLAGSPGDDRFFGNGGDDLLVGQAGDDALFGGTGDDFISGGGGNDLLRGSDGDDVLVDGQGADTLRGDTGDDLIISSTAINLDALSDQIAAQDPDQPLNIDPGDILFNFDPDSDDQGDQVFGGYGDDVIIAGPDDTVTLGEGLDALVLGTWGEGEGSTTVTDFTENEDTLIYAYDATQSAPEMTLEYSDDLQDALLFANGNLVALIQGAGGFFTLADVNLTPVSAPASAPA